MILYRRILVSSSEGVAAAGALAAAAAGASEVAPDFFMKGSLSKGSMQEAIFGVFYNCCGIFLLLRVEKAAWRCLARTLLPRN